MWPRVRRQQPLGSDLPRGKLGYRDGGILDFGRWRAYRDEETRTEFVLPSSLVEFIARNANRGDT